MTDVLLWTDAHSLALALGVVASLLTSLVTNVHPEWWTGWKKQLAALVIAVCTGVGDAIATGQITNGMHWLTVVAVVVAVSEAAYRTVLSRISAAVQNQQKTVDGQVVGAVVDTPYPDGRAVGVASVNTSHPEGYPTAAAASSSP
jgi:Zn-dependent alcohol dehydrogenase